MTNLNSRTLERNAVRAAIPYYLKWMLIWGIGAIIVGFLFGVVTGAGTAALQMNDVAAATSGQLYFPYPYLLAWVGGSLLTEIGAVHLAAGGTRKSLLRSYALAAVTVAVIATVVATLMSIIGSAIGLTPGSAFASIATMFTALISDVIRTLVFIFVGGAVGAVVLAKRSKLTIAKTVLAGLLFIALAVIATNGEIGASTISGIFNTAAIGDITEPANLTWLGFTGWPAFTAATLAAIAVCALTNQWLRWAITRVQFPAKS